MIRVVARRGETLMIADPEAGKGAILWAPGHDPAVIHADSAFAFGYWDDAAAPLPPLPSDAVAELDAFNEARSADGQATRSGVDEDDLERRHSYPGQKYRHGWIPVSPGPGRHRVSAEDRPHLEDGDQGSPETPASVLAWIVDNRDKVTSVARHRPVSDRRDTTLAAIGTRRGYDAPPQVATEADLDAAIGDGWTEMWRGVQDTADDTTAAEIAAGFRAGAYEPGSGNYGNGYYTSAGRYVAEQYSGAVLWPVNGRQWDDNGKYVGEYRGGAPGGMMRMAMSPDARVIDLTDLRAEIDAWRESEEYYAIPDTPTAVALLDPGRYAAMRGYDAVLIRDRGDGAEHPPGTTPETRPPQYIVLNRGRVMVQEA